MWRFVIASLVSSFLYVHVTDGAVGDLKIKPLGSEPLVKALGSSMIFTCQSSRTDDGPPIAFQWLDNNGKSVTERAGGRRYVESSGDTSLKLYITQIEMSDAGKYTCRATDADETKEKSVQLQLYEEISFVNTLAVQHPEINKTATIGCTVRGSPLPVVQWIYNGKPVNTKPGSRFQKTEKGLTITAITQADNGNYTCRAEVESDGRLDERVINVIVHIPPTMLTPPPAEKEGTHGLPVSISCKADGLPAPTYKFLKGDVEVVGSDSVSVDTVKGVLQFNPVRKTDEASYWCKAINDVGEAKARSFVKVLVVPVVTIPSNVSHNEGDSTTLTCQSQGDPHPNMTFVKDGHVFSSTDKTGDRVSVSTKIPGQLELKITKLLVADAGVYTCHSFNKVGRHNGSIKLTVNYKPAFSNSNSLVVHSWANAKHNLTCQVFGLPIPSIQWQRFGSVIGTENSTYRLYTESDSNSTTSRLEISPTYADMGWMFNNKDDVYLCKATNAISTETWRVQLKRATSPEKPNSVNATAVYADAAVLVVTAPLQTGGIPITGYTVEYSETPKDVSAGQPVATVTPGGKPGVAPTMPPHVHSHSFESNTTRIDGLKAETRYVVRVKAKNAVDFGPTTEIMITTLKQSVPGEVLIKEAPVGLKGRYYTVSWEVPNTGGLPVLGYQFNYTKLKSDGSVATDGSAKLDAEQWITETVDVDGKQKMEHELKDLSPQTTYKVRMRARNKLGWSQPSKTVTFKTLEDSDVYHLHSASIGVGAMIGIVFVIIVLILAVVDISRYFRNRCGVTTFICRRVCGAESIRLGTKEREIEKGERERLNAPGACYDKEQDQGGESKGNILVNEIELQETPQHKVANENNTTAGVKDGISELKPSAV